MNKHWISFLNLACWKGNSNWENVTSGDFNAALQESRQWIKENISYIPVEKAQAAFKVYILEETDPNWPKEKQTTNTGFYILKDAAQIALATMYRKEYNERNQPEITA